MEEGKVGERNGDGDISNGASPRWVAGESPRGRKGDADDDTTINAGSGALQ